MRSDYVGICAAAPLRLELSAYHSKKAEEKDSKIKTIQHESRQTATAVSRCTDHVRQNCRRAHVDATKALRGQSLAQRKEQR